MPTIENRSIVEPDDGRLGAGERRATEPRGSVEPWRDEAEVAIQTAALPGRAEPGEPQLGAAGGRQEVVERRLDGSAQAGFVLGPARDLDAQHLGPPCHLPGGLGFVPAERITLQPRRLAESKAGPAGADQQAVDAEFGPRHGSAPRAAGRLRDRRSGRRGR